MISKEYKKQLIVNAYVAQLLTDTDIVEKRIRFNANKRIKDLLLFRIIDDLWVGYKYKYETIDNDIRWFFNYLINPIYSIYKYSEEYSEDKESDIQQNLSNDIKELLEQIQIIKDNPNYAKYLEDIYD